MSALGCPDDDNWMGAVVLCGTGGYSVWCWVGPRSVDVLAMMVGSPFEAQLTSGGANQYRKGLSLEGSHPHVQRGIEQMIVVKLVLNGLHLLYVRHDCNSSC